MQERVKSKTGNAFIRRSKTPFSTFPPTWTYIVPRVTREDGIRQTFWYGTESIAGRNKDVSMPLYKQLRCFSHTQNTTALAHAAKKPEREEPQRSQPVRRRNQRRAGSQSILYARLRILDPSSANKPRSLNTQSPLVGSIDSVKQNFSSATTVSVNLCRVSEERLIINPSASLIRVRVLLLLPQAPPGEADNYANCIIFGYTIGN